MGELSPWHWAIIAIVVIVLFGTKKLPDAARSLGRSLRIFKTEMSALHDDDSPPAVQGASGPAADTRALEGESRPNVPTG